MILLVTFNMAFTVFLVDILLLFRSSHLLPPSSDNDANANLWYLRRINWCPTLSHHQRFFFHHLIPLFFCCFLSCVFPCCICTGNRCGDSMCNKVLKCILIKQILRYSGVSCRYLFGSSKYYHWNYLTCLLLHLTMMPMPLVVPQKDKLV